MTAVLAAALPLIAALLLDAWLGEPRWLWDRWPHPAVLMGRLVAWLDQRMNHGTRRRARGVLALIVLLCVAGLLGTIAARFGAVAEAVVAAVLLAQKALVEHVAAVVRGLRLSNRDGQIAVSMIVSRDTRHMNRSQIARSALESAAENLSDGVIAPAFWFLIAGAPGILIYKFVNTADSMIGYRTLRHKDFGWAAARFDDLLNLIPARLTALLIAVPHGPGAWRDIARDARRHKSPNAGWPEAALARRLRVALAGPRAYDGTLHQYPWVNSGAATDIGAIEIEAGIGVLWAVWRRAIVLLLVIALL